MYFKGFLNLIKWNLKIKKELSFGANKFIPVIFKRTVVKIDGNIENKKILRWKKIAEVAAKQSKRNIIPEVENIKNVKNICNLIPEYDIVLLAYEQENKCSLKDALKEIKLKNQKELNIGIIIGPEGGLEQAEVDELEQAGAKVITLGKRILRTETVALAVIAIINYELED